MMHLTRREMLCRTGTGLGLSIAYGIMRDHEGTISIDDSSGDGAAFVIELPLASDCDAPEDTP